MHREDFPFFVNIDNSNSDTSLKGNTISNNTPIYLDNAASSQTPKVVVEAMNDYYYNYKSNIHRGVYKSSELASDRYDQVRKLVAEFLGVRRDDIIFTGGSTYASNMLITMLEQYIKWNRDDIIITSYYEHHSILLPIIELARRHDLQIYYVDHAKAIDWKILIESLGRDKVKLINLTVASNVTGEVFDMANISYAIRALYQNNNHKMLPIIIGDITAIAGHGKVNLHNLGLDAAWCGAHKMCGPTGVGVLYIRREYSRMMRPVIYGGGMVWKVESDSATYRSDIEAYEAGTSNIAGVIGLGAAVKYLQDVGLDNIRERIAKLHSYAVEKLSALSYLKLYTSDSESNVGIVSFSIDKIHPHDIAQVLSDHNIAVRAGHHCVQMYMKYVGEIALTRVSLYFYNTEGEIDQLIEAIEIAYNKLR